MWPPDEPYTTSNEKPEIEINVHAVNKLKHTCCWYIVICKLLCFLNMLEKNLLTWSVWWQKLLCVIIIFWSDHTVMTSTLGCLSWSTWCITRQDKIWPCHIRYDSELIYANECCGSVCKHPGLHLQEDKGWFIQQSNPGVRGVITHVRCPLLWESGAAVNHFKCSYFA